MGWQTGTIHSLPRCGSGGGLSICLSVCVSGGKLYSRSASVPNRWLSALTARRGRGAKEKAPGEEQSRSGPMPEQEEGADRVSAAGKQGSWVHQHSGELSLDLLQAALGCLGLGRRIRRQRSAGVGQGCLGRCQQVHIEPTGSDDVSWSTHAHAHSLPGSAAFPGSPQSRSLPFHLECAKQVLILSLPSPIS